MDRYSDMILEVANMSRLMDKLHRRSYTRRGVKCHTFEVAEGVEQKCGRGVGKYYAFEGGADVEISRAISDALKVELGEICNTKLGTATGAKFGAVGNSKSGAATGTKLGTAIGAKLGAAVGKVLLVGLGNPNFVADKLGTATLDKVTLADNIAKLYPLCGALTNISSFEILSGVVARIAPSCVIIIDTLATSKAHRLGNSYQLTTAGMAPGGGVNNQQKTINSQALGVPTLALGVPLIMKSCGYSSDTSGALLTLASVDESVAKCSEILANGINLALN